MDTTESISVSAQSRFSDVSILIAPKPEGDSTCISVKINRNGYSEQITYKFYFVSALSTE